MVDYLDDDTIHSKLSIVLILFASGVMGHIIIYCIVAAIRWCNRCRDLQNPQSLSEIAEMKSSIGNSTVQLISTHKYQKDMELIGDDGTCPVCLSEFEEGEDLCSLPKCLHTFHVACINMWLISHPSCPMCRVDAMPSPQIFCGVTESSGAIEFEMHQEPSMLQDGVVQARPV